MKAMILAAGFGSRLGALTANTPKCLIDINGKPILRLVAENLARAGVTEIVINLHFEAEQVRSYAVSSLSDLFTQIEFSHETVLLGTGGALKVVESFFTGEDNFLLVNADIYSSFNLNKLLRPLIEDKELLGNLAVMDRADKTYLEFDKDGYFCGWLKAVDQALPSSKSSKIDGNSVHAFCGLQALSSRIFDFLRNESQSSFSVIETYMKAAKNGDRILFSDIGAETWFDMGTPEQLEFLRDSLKR